MTIAKARARVVRAAMRLYNARRAGLKYPPFGMDCEGFYWTLRHNNRGVQCFKHACAALASAEQAGKRRKLK